MTLHFYAEYEFPPDCNDADALLLRRELAYYVYRSKPNMTTKVHLEDYSPTVPFPKVQVFFQKVFGDLIRLDRLNPQRIYDRIKFTARHGESAVIFKNEIRRILHRAFLDLDPMAYNRALLRYYTIDKRTGRRVHHYEPVLPNAPGQLKRGQEHGPAPAFEPGPPPPRPPGRDGHPPREHRNRPSAPPARPGHTAADAAKSAGWSAIWSGRKPADSHFPAPGSPASS